MWLACVAHIKCIYSTSLDYHYYALLQKKKNSVPLGLFYPLLLNNVSTLPPSTSIPTDSPSLFYKHILLLHLGPQ